MFCSIIDYHVQYHKITREKQSKKKTKQKQMHLLCSYTDLMTDTWKQGKALSATHTPEFNSHAHHNHYNEQH